MQINDALKDSEDKGVKEHKKKVCSKIIPWIIVEGNCKTNVQTSPLPMSAFKIITERD